MSCHNNIKQCNVQNNYDIHVIKRFKSHKKRTVDNKDNIDESESDDESDDEIEAPIGSKVLTVKSSSIRIDNICKIGFGMSRNKVEEAFYKSKIRINGQKVLKKSKEVQEGDEIDMILHQKLDDELLVVNRIVILSMSSANDSIRIKLSRDKNLLVEDYEKP
ncbi:hypothetical protein HN011_008341 [Eciton burchellii]|nr:hypothetical protein HN011_008341 [Eciton burchellii]